MHYAEVIVRSMSDKALARGLVTVNISGDRSGLAEVDSTSQLDS